MDTNRAGIVFSCSFCSFSFLLFAGTNPYLTFHCVSQGTILLDLAPDDKEYQSVEEEVIQVPFLVLQGPYSFLSTDNLSEPKCAIHVESGFDV